jgi:hypothetical protein
MPIPDLLKRGATATVTIAVLLAMILVSMYYSWTPAPIRSAQQRSQPIGVQTTDALIQVADTLLTKNGGYISNDVTPPSWWLDNIQNWEFGVLKQVRDFTRVLRNELSRSQSQSTEDPALIVAEPKFSIDNDSWMFPRAEGAYRDGINALQGYRDRLAANAADAHFYARADNLVDWLNVVEKRLGNSVQQLGMSVGKMSVSDRSMGVALETGENLAPSDIGESIEKTPWYRIDDVFYEARGTAWALLALFEAAEADFAEVLQDKNATISYRQIIRELEAANAGLATPWIMNGGGFNMWPNHSLVMASYLSAANTAISNLITLLENG